MGRSMRQRINLKVALDTQNVFLTWQDSIEQQWSLPYGKRMHVIWTRSMLSPTFVRSPAEWQGDEKLVYRLI